MPQKYNKPLPRNHISEVMAVGTRGDLGARLKERPAFPRFLTLLMTSLVKPGSWRLYRECLRRKGVFPLSDRACTEHSRWFHPDLCQLGSVSTTNCNTLVVRVCEHHLSRTGRCLRNRNTLGQEQQAGSDVIPSTICEILIQMVAYNRSTTLTTLLCACWRSVTASCQPPCHLYVPDLLLNLVIR